MNTRIAAAALLTLTALPVFPQADTRAAESRAGEIEASRRSKLQTVQPDDVSAFEGALVRIKEEKVLERLTAGIAGVRLRFGGLVTGSGFAIGPEYLRRDLAGGQLTLRSSVRASAKKYQLYDLQLTAPALAGGLAFADFTAAHRNYPEMQYFGPGADSSERGRSLYRLEDTSFDLAAGVRPLGPLRIGGEVGYLQANVGPGGADRFPSTDRLFGPTTTPGVDRQSDFLRGGAFAAFDWRDIPGTPRNGGLYLARFSHYSDRTLGLHSFRRFDLEAQQYFGFFNDRRVIALRAKTTLTDAAAGQRVPFYLQPSLGGSDDLRGFRAFRFYDDNMVVFNAEYRWESFSGLDVAIFGDAGRVFHSGEDWGLSDLEASYGFGLRFNIGNSVFMRTDVGFSHEGYQLWLKFDNVF